jgi:hypothetical protein
LADEVSRDVLSDRSAAMISMMRAIIYPISQNEMSICNEIILRTILRSLFRQRSLIAAVQVNPCDFAAPDGEEGGGMGGRERR